jgi:hypothetical protein
MSETMLAAFRHDAHKFTGESHDDARETFQGVRVNQSVPHDADRDAAALSRPAGPPEQTVDAHGTHYRLSLLTGESRYNPETFSRPQLSEAFDRLLTNSNPEMTHRAWLTSEVASGFNESLYYPYTSLKYHTLLVAALLDNYREGHEFAELHLVVDDAAKIVPHRTIYAGARFALRIDVDTDDNPWARLGRRPWRSWASVWNRLTAHPLNADHDKHDMVLDANLRRIQSWSTALQYIEEFESRKDDP